MAVRSQQYGFFLDPYDATLRTHPYEAKLICRGCACQVACSMDNILSFKTNRETLLHNYKANPDICVISDDGTRIIVKADPARINAYCREFVSHGGNDASSNR